MDKTNHELLLKPEYSEAISEISLETKYSESALRDLQENGDIVSGSVRNARADLGKRMGLPMEFKGVRIKLYDALLELESYSLADIAHDQNRNPSKIKSISITELGLVYPLPPSDN